MSKRVALVIARRDGLVLFGKRANNGRWTLPGGHLEDGEEPAAGARRELLEETGLEPAGDLRLVDERVAPNGLKLYTYSCEVEGTPTGAGDPDAECALWAFFDVADGIPKAVGQNMAGPKDPDENVAADVLGLAKMAISDFGPGKPTAGNEYDYSHVLKPEHKAAGYSIRVVDGLKDPQGSILEAHLHHNGNPVGKVGADVGDIDMPDKAAYFGLPEGSRYLTPHSELGSEHRGRGLGTAMYEALYAHALHSGINSVLGFRHSEAASRVHQGLARKHGLTYVKGKKIWRGKLPYGRYQYVLKSEGAQHRVALIVARRDGLVLFGKRSDNGRWTLPGGHLEEGEDPRAGARRELREETGLEPEGELKLIDQRETESGLKLYTYSCEVTGAPSGKHDPDQECQLWAFFDVADGIPKAVGQNMAGPKDPDENVAADVLGLAKMAIRDIAAPNPHPAGGYDYTHVLPDAARAAGYRLRVEHWGSSSNGKHVRAEVTHPNGYAGYAEALIKPNRSVMVEDVQLNREGEHRGKGLGRAMYEALYHHAMTRHDVPKAIGEAHSTSARRVHQALRRVHGLAYRAKDKSPGLPEADYNARFGPYSYALKDELPMAKEEDEQVVSVPAVAKTRKSRAKTPKAPAPAPEENLVGVHNLTAGNLRHAHDLGGLVAPSLAVTGRENPLENFGEISLVANHHLIDPAQVPVYDADVYSPRHPRAKYSVNQKPLRAFQAWIKPHADKVGAYFGDAEDKFNEGGIDAFSHFRHRQALGAAFLAEKGINLPAPTREKKFSWVDEPSMRDFVAKNPDADYEYRDSPDYPAFEAAAHEAIGQHAARVGKAANFDDDDVREMAEGLKEQFKNTPHSRILQDLKAPPGGERDPNAYGEAVEAEVKRHPDFEAWVKERLKPVVGNPYLPQGVDTANGPSERKRPYTAENVLREMTRGIRNAEGFNYGLGSARSVGAKKFKDFEQMRAARGKIVPREEFERHKEGSDAEFGQLAEALGRYHHSKNAFMGMEDASRALADSFRRGKGVQQALAENGFRNVPPELATKLADFGRRLVAMPTEYFEAKPQRVVGINEFAGAAVPKDVAPDVHDILRHHGIQHVESYDPAVQGDRARAVNRLAAAKKLLLAERPLAKTLPVAHDDDVDDGYGPEVEVAVHPAAVMREWSTKRNEG